MIHFVSAKPSKVQWHAGVFFLWKYILVQQVPFGPGLRRRLRCCIAKHKKGCCSICTRATLSKRYGKSRAYSIQQCIWSSKEGLKRRKKFEVVSDKTIKSMKEYDHYIWQTSKGTCLHHSSKLTVPRQAGAAGAADTNREDDDADDEDYNPNEKANWIAADSVSQQSEELWWISQTNTKHVCHRNLVAVERLAPLNHEQNVRLGIVMLAFDYSENGMMKDINQVESQYWVTIQQTKPIASETQTKDWNKQGGRNEL